MKKIKTKNDHSCVEHSFRFTGGLFLPYSPVEEAVDKAKKLASRLKEYLEEQKKSEKYKFEICSHLGNPYIYQRYLDHDEEDKFQEFNSLLDRLKEVRGIPAKVICLGYGDTSRKKDSVYIKTDSRGYIVDDKGITQGSAGTLETLFIGLEPFSWNVFNIEKANKVVGTFFQRIWKREITPDNSPYILPLEKILDLRNK